jgi:RNA-directed DNA polymerase
MVLEPIFENEFAEHSYGFRPGRRADDALQRVMSLIEARYVHVVDLDFASYFDTIPHAPLLALISRKVADSRVLSLVESFLSAGVMEDGVQQWKPTTGTPQGGVISPLLSNIYLDPLDHLLAGAGIEAVRYADDCVLLCRDEVSARRALQMVREWSTSVGLRLHPEKTRVVNATTEAFEFLGYRFERMEKIRPRKSSWQKFKNAVREKTRRTTGESMACVIGRLKPLIYGWANYFRRCSMWVFRDMDQWIRMRLRSMLRRRKGKEGRGRGSDHQRWPNAYFKDQGLPSLEQLVIRHLQSASR